MKRAGLAVLFAAALGVASCSSGSEQAADGTFEAERVDDIGDLGADELIDLDQTDPCASGADDPECVPDGDESGSDVPTSAVEPEAIESEGVEPEGFSTVMVEITKADGEVCEVCMWLADTSEERGRGLMGVTSLGEPEGMAFAWDAPTAGSFYMFHTVTPLSIAWFAAPAISADDTGDDAGGALVSMMDMEPCLAESSADCERFPAGGDYMLAVEVFQGDLASIGITDGATARLLPDTESPTCPLT